MVSLVNGAHGRGRSMRGSQVCLTYVLPIASVHVPDSLHSSRIAPIIDVAEKEKGLSEVFSESL